MVRKVIRPALCVLAAALGGCEMGIVCSDVGSYAVNVEIRDALTGAPAVEGATLIITDGVYADTARGQPGAPPVLAAGLEREGTFDVRVQKAGYQDFTRRGVRVERGGGCDALQGTRLTALLERAQPGS